MVYNIANLPFSIWLWLMFLVEFGNGILNLSDVILKFLFKGFKYFVHKRRRFCLEFGIWILNLADVILKLHFKSFKFLVQKSRKVCNQDLDYNCYKNCNQNCSQNLVYQAPKFCQNSIARRNLVGWLIWWFRRGAWSWKHFAILNILTNLRSFICVTVGFPPKPISKYLEIS